MTTPDPLVQLDQRRLLRTARRHVAIILSGLSLGLVGGAAFASQYPTEYGANSSVQLGDPVSLNAVLATTTGTTTSRTAAAVGASQLAELSGTDTQARAEKGLAGRADHTLTFSPSTTDPSTVTITATSRDSKTAQDAANGYAHAYLEGVSADSQALLQAATAQLQANIDALTTEVQQLEQTLSSTPSTSLAQVQAVVGPEHDDAVSRRGVLRRELAQVHLLSTVGAVGSARIVSPADDPSPTSSGPVLVLLGGLFGLLLAAFAVAWRESRAGTVVDEDDVRLTGLQAGRVVRLDVPRARRPLSRDEDLLADADHARLRVLSASLLTTAPGQGTACLFTAADRDAVGTTMLVARLARQVSSGGRQVTVITADPRGEVFESVFGPLPALGLDDLLTGAATLDQILVDQPGPLRVLSASGVATLPAEASVPTVVEDLIRLGQTVLLLGRPLGESAEALLLLPATGRMVVVVREGQTRRRDLTSIRRALGEQFGSARAVEEELVVLVQKRPRLLARQRPATRSSTLQVPQQQSDRPKLSGAGVSDGR